MSKSKPFYIYLFPAFILTTFVISAIIYFSTTKRFTDFYEEQTKKSLQKEAELLSYTLKNCMVSGQNIDSLVQVVGKKTETRFTVIQRDGKVIADSEKKLALMDNHSDRPEFLEALTGRIGFAIRFSETVKSDLMYVAIPYESFILRSSIHLTNFSSEVSNFTHDLGVAMIVAVAITILLSLLLTWVFTRPIEDLKQRAKLLSEGTFTPPLIKSSISEIADLSDIMQNSADIISRRLRSLSHQKERLRGILGGMIEGVVAFDNEEKVFLINEAARKMLDIEVETVKGHQIQELVRNVAFQQIVAELTTTREEICTNILISTDSDSRILNINCRILENSNSFIIVMHNVTDLKRLENLRRDFTGNVSSALKIPLTSIKSFVETLVDGAINDPDDANHFLRIINLQVDRLNRLIEDLLMIARLEKEEETGAVNMETHTIRPICETVISNCRGRADKKDIKIVYRSEDDSLSGNLVPSLLEQALSNLIDNAIKFSNFGTVVAVEVAAQDKYLSIAVSDEGTGIPSQHLPRLFERFYRVDKAQSNLIGGTGLGLSVVKHIVSVQNGSVSVESTVGKGSKFSILLPIINEK